MRSDALLSDVAHGATLSTGLDLDFHSRDLGATEDFLGGAYAKMTVSSDDSARHEGTRIVRRWLGPVNFDELHIDFDLDYDAEPLHRICLCRVHDGRIEEDFAGEPRDVFAPGDVALLTPPDRPYSGRVCHASYDLTMFPTALLSTVASAGGPEHPVRLTGHRPVDARAAQRLDAVITYLRQLIGNRTDPLAPLVASSTAAMLAAVVLSALPNDAETDVTPQARRSAVPTLLRRAVAFVDDNAHRDITLADIAASVHLTPRALQYMFRRHMDLTPTEYLRRVRMSHVHRDLLAADSTAVTVHTVATRWGFAHTGRFAAAYQVAYGRKPSETLRT
jgi:AraC-like DNA-binding protein